MKLLIITLFFYYAPDYDLHVYDISTSYSEVEIIEILGEGYSKPVSVHDLYNKIKDLKRLRYCHPYCGD